MKTNTEIYIVTAYKWGQREAHSYNIGVFTKKAQAIKCAESHAGYRGGKYACVVDKCILNHFDNEDDEYTTEIYRAKALNEMRK